MARPKKQIRLKQPVTLREKKIKNGNLSLYLDIYHKGVRKYEYLKLYIVPEVDQSAKIMNRQTREIAEKIRAERILQLQSHGIEHIEKAKRSRILLSTWLDQYTKEDSGISDATRHGRKMTQLRVNEYLKEIKGETISLCDIDKEFCLSFINHLKTSKHRNYNKEKKKAPTISQTTINYYQVIFSAALTKAVKEGIIKSNPFKQLEARQKVRPKNKEIEYLTIDELRTLINTDCGNPDLKVAFIFSCFTGLRKSDVKRLTNSDIKLTPDGVSRQIVIRMQKTKDTVIIPLSDEALKWLPKVEDNKIPIFNVPANQSTLSWHLTTWVKRAKIEKHITFHCARHTFGTMLLTLGTDIYTVSKLMGHKSVAVTEVYAKIVDSKKIDAMVKVDDYFK